MSSLRAAEVVVERVRALLRERLALEVAADELDLIEEGYLDSLALVELLFELERAFAVELGLHDLDVDDFRSVRRIADFVAGAGGA